MQYILNEINLHSSLNEEDLVKLIYQRVYGPSHILLNIEKGKEYLIQELKILPEEKYNDIEIGGNLIRVSLHNVKNVDTFYDALIKTAKLKQGTIEEYQNEIKLLIKYISSKNLNFDIKYIQELAKENKPIHHSKIYNELYKPHYRIIDITNLANGRISLLTLADSKADIYSALLSVVMTTHS